MKILKILKEGVALTLLTALVISFAFGVYTLDMGEEKGEDKNALPDGDEPDIPVFSVPDEFTLGDIVDVSRDEYTYEEMEVDLLELAEKYPRLLRVASAGKSLDGREIYYADLGDPNAPRSIMINSGIHGREYMTPLLIMKQLEYHLENYEKTDETGECFAESFSGLLIRIVPMINPDGIALSQKGIGGLRSEELRGTVERIYLSDRTKYDSYKKYQSIDDYLKFWKANAHGVDLNRNFGIDYWETLKTGIPQPSAQKYKGEAPNSEPESQALIALTQSLTGLCASVSIHSQGEIIYWDCGQTDASRVATWELCYAISKENGYRPYIDFEHPDATYNDWCVLELGVPSVNVETGNEKCPLPIEQFEEIWTRNLGLWTAVAELYK